MRTISKFFLFVPLLLSSCSTNNLSSCSENNPLAKKAKDVKELFMTSNIDFSTKINNGFAEKDLVSVYSDNEKIIETANEDPLIIKTYTPTLSYLDGDGFKVRANSSHSFVFTNSKETIHIDDFAANEKSDDSFDFSVPYIDVQKCQTALTYEINRHFSKYLKDIEVEKLLFTVTFDENRIKRLELILDEEIKKIDFRQTYLRYIFKINSYGSNLDKQSMIDTSGFLDVTIDEYNIVAKDLDCVINNHQGFTFYRITDAKYKSELSPDDLVGRLSLLVDEEYDVKLYLKDITYHEDTGLCSYVYIGKEFVFELNVLNSYALEKTGELTANLEIQSDATIFSDVDNDCLLAESNGALKILSLSSLNVLKTLSFEGDIVNIVNYDDFYHVMTVTQTAGPDSYKDTACYGYIYTVSKTSLEIIDSLYLNTYPYNTAVDKRGDIIIVPGYGQHVPLYIYHSQADSFEVLYDSFFSQAYEGDYIEYDEEEDKIILNHTRLSGGVYPMFLYYIDDHYDYPKSCNTEIHTDFGDVLLKLDNYLICMSSYYQSCSLADVHDWKNPTKKYVCNDFEHRPFNAKFAFRNQNSAFVAGYYKYEYGSAKGYAVSRLDFGASGIKESFYEIPGETSNYVFGLSRNNQIYLYDYSVDSFSIFDCPTA